MRVWRCWCCRGRYWWEARSRRGGSKAPLFLIGPGAGTLARWEYRAIIIRFRRPCPKLSVCCLMMPRQLLTLRLAGIWWRWWVRCASWSKAINLAILKSSSLNPTPSLCNRLSLSRWDEWLPCSSRKRLHLFCGLWFLVGIFWYCGHACRPPVTFRLMSLNEILFTWCKDKRLFWWEDDVLDWALMVMVLLGSAPMRVILVIGEDTHNSPVVSSQQFSNFVGIPSKCKPCAFTGNHYLPAGLSFLARKIAL